MPLSVTTDGAKTINLSNLYVAEKRYLVTCVSAFTFLSHIFVGVWEANVCSRIVSLTTCYRYDLFTFYTISFQLPTRPSF